MICFFGGDDDNFYITEYGHTLLDCERVIPQRIRETYLLHIIISGVCHFSEFDADAGQAFLISKNKIHDFHVAQGYEHFWFAFDGKAVSSLLSSFGLPESSHVLLNIEDADIVKKMLYLSFDKTVITNSEIYAKSVLCALFPLLKTQNGECENTADVLRAKLFIERNYADRITMRNVAEHVHLSEKHLCRKFKIAYGMPPQRYLLSVRMARAEKLLQTTSFSVKTVSESVGYTSPQIFSQVYKDYFGYSPQRTSKI